MVEWNKAVRVVAGCKAESKEGLAAEDGQGMLGGGREMYVHQRM